MWKWVFSASVLLPVLAVGALLYAYIGEFDFVPWFIELRNWQTGLGAYFGLLAILIGAMFNAHLVRDREQKNQVSESRSLAAAISGRLTLILEDINTHYSLLWDEPAAVFEENADEFLNTFLERFRRHSEATQLPIEQIVKLPSELIRAVNDADEWTYRTMRSTENQVTACAAGLRERAINSFVEQTTRSKSVLLAAQKTLKTYSDTGVVEEMPGEFEIPGIPRFKFPSSTQTQAASAGKPVGTSKT